MDENPLRPDGETSIAAATESRLRLLIDTGLLLARETSLDVIVQAALDAGLELSDAAFGAFFYHSVGADGVPQQLFKISGNDAQRLNGFSIPPPEAILTLAAQGDSIVRADDVMTDPRFAREALQPAMAPSDGSSPPRSSPAPLRSYLAVPVRSRGGDVMGALLYGHTAVAVFKPEVESLVATVAAQAAVAIENARLTETLRREIAEAEDARADQRATDRRLRQALAAAQLGTWRWNAATGLIDFDERAAALYEVPAHVPLARNELRERLLHPEDLALSPADLHEVLRSDGQYTAEYRVKTGENQERWLSINGHATVSEGSAAITGITGTVQDITARKLQETALRTSEKLAATGRLAATIAHEINNPLEAVTNLIYLAKTDPETPPAVGRLLETADGELMRVSQIAQQTLGFYRDTTHPVPIDLNEMLNAVVELFGRKLTGKRLQCTLDLEPGLSIIGLQGEIRQVVSNLLVNAIDASPLVDGRIRIRGRRRPRSGEGGVSVLISDCGSGIPEAVRPRLFTPFTTTKKTLGTGLGLWVTRGMVEKHGGSIRFRSRTETPSGTVFRVYLPESGHPQLFASQSSVVLQ